MYFYHGIARKMSFKNVFKCCSLCLVMLKLKPSVRIKRRYLLLKAESKSVVEKTMLDYIGILGYAKASPFFVENGGEKIVLSVDRKMVDDVRAAFELSKEKIKVVKVSGTLKGLGK